MAAPERLQRPAVIVKEWMRPGDLLWLAAGLALIGAIVLVQTQVTPGDQVRIGADSAFPKFADTTRTPMQLPMIAALGWVVAKFGSHPKSLPSARIDADGIELYADSKYGIRMKIGAPKAEAPWSAIKCVVVRRRRSTVLRVLPVWTTVLSFERPSGKRYGRSASVSPWSLGKIAAGVARFAPQVEVLDDRHGKRRVLTP